MAGMIRWSRSGFWRAIAVSCGIAACGEAGPAEKHFDTELSAQLIVPGKAIVDPTARVARLEIRVSPQVSRDLISPAEVRQHRLVFETRDPEVIRSLISSARQDLSGECNPQESPTVLHVMAFDEPADEVGCVRLFPCEDTADIAIMAYGDNAIVFSKTLRSNLRALGIK
jgi:hypothetical protein